MRGAVIAAFAAAAPLTGLSGLNPEAIQGFDLGQVEWKPAAGLPGADSATLVGDPATPGFYVVLNRFHPGNFSKPHYHANDRYIVVLSGTWWVGTGFKSDPEHDTVPVRPGAFVVHAGREVHYDGSRTGSGEAVVMIFGQGPGSRIECTGPTAETGPGPCANARAKAGAS